MLNPTTDSIRNIELKKLECLKEMSLAKDRILKELSGVDKITLTRLRQVLDDYNTIDYNVNSKISSIETSTKELNKKSEENVKKFSDNIKKINDIELNLNNNYETLDNKIDNINDKLTNDINNISNNQFPQNYVETTVENAVNTYVNENNGSFTSLSKFNNHINGIESILINVGNLLDINDIIQGGYYHADTFVENEDYQYTPLISINQHHIYTTNISGANGFASFYDKDKNYISGDVLLSSYNVKAYDDNFNELTDRYIFKAPTNAFYVRFSTPNNQTIWINENAQINEPKLYKEYKIIENVKTYNYFNKNNSVAGYYSSNGLLLEKDNNSGYLSDFIPYIGKSILYNINGGVPIVAYDKDYNILETFASSIAFNNASVNNTINANTTYFKCYYNVNDKPMYIKSDSIYPIDKIYVEYGVIPKEFIINFTTSENNKLFETLFYSEYRNDTDIPLYIILENGVYDCTLYTNTLNNLIKNYGVSLGDNVHIIGKDKNKTIIKGEFTTNGEFNTLYSPLNINKNNTLKNITVIANNCRYAIHCDTNNNNKEIKEVFENCVFHHKGNDKGWYYPSAFGGGLSENSSYIFNQCEFIADSYTSAGFHNNTSQSSGAYIVYNNCKFKGDTIDYSFDAYENHEINEIIFNSCYFDTGNINYTNASSITNNFNVELWNCNDVTINKYTQNNIENLPNIFIM